jgi:hypothetical protein
VLDESGPHWQATADLTFYLQCDEFPTPTFTLGFASLRYALAMQMKLFNRRGHTAANSLRLRSPLQVAYTSVHQIPTECPEYEPHMVPRQRDFQDCAEVENVHVSPVLQFLIIVLG